VLRTQELQRATKRMIRKSKQNYDRTQTVEGSSNPRPDPLDVQSPRRSSCGESYAGSTKEPAGSRAVGIPQTGARRQTDHSRAQGREYPVALHQHHDMPGPEDDLRPKVYDLIAKKTGISRDRIKPRTRHRNHGRAAAGLNVRSTVPSLPVRFLAPRIRGPCIAHEHRAFSEWRVIRSEAITSLGTLLPGDLPPISRAAQR
jgi:hypothetical protein